MSISSAISNARSGLTAVSRGTELVSSNIANARTPGYARRELELASRPSELGGGVHIVGVNRIMNAGLLADSRLAQAGLGGSQTASAFHVVMEKLVGTGQEASSLGQMLTAFDAALTSAAARPDNETRLGNVLTAATNLAGKLNSISDTIQAERTTADHAVSKDVARLNAGLEQVAALNKQIVSLSAQGKDTSSLLDSRQAVINGISDIVPLKEVPRENGRVALFTVGGAALLDGTEPAKISFEKAGNVTPEMSVANGALARLTFNGKALTPTQMDMFGGGTISANFKIRDQVAPEYQRQIDGFAREIYDRLADPAIDATVNPGGPGLFTDAQTALDPANETGFAGRIAVTALVDPSSGGELWRIRAGVNAANAGDSGESGLLGRLGSALSTTRLPVSGSLPQQSQSLSSMAAQLASFTSTSRIQAEAAALQDITHQNSLQSALLADGVDTDQEMEGLLALERAYSANAKVFQTANDMLDAILRLT